MEDGTTKPMWLEEMAEQLKGNTMSKETTMDDWIKFVKKEVCDKCNYLNKSFGVCGGEILPIERAIMRNLEGRGNCKDIKEFAAQLKAGVKNE